MPGAFPRTIDGVTYDLLQPGEEAAAAKLAAEDFCIHEPCSRSLKIDPKESTPVLLRLCKRGIEDGVSLKAVDDSTGEIVGIRVAFMREKTREEEDEELYKECAQELLPERLRPFADFLAIVGGEAGDKIFETYGVDRYIEFFFISVREDFRGKQIAQRLLIACYDHYKALNVKMVKVIASNPRTAHIFRNKHGFEEINSFNILEFEHKGKPFFGGIQEIEVIPTFVKILDK